MKIACTGCDGRGYAIKRVQSIHGAAVIRSICRWCDGKRWITWRNTFK